MTYAVAADVTVRWARTATAEEASLIDTRLADVERMILRRIPDLVAKVTATTIDVADVVQVEADAVLRLVRNPDGFMSETDGDYTYQLHKDLSTGRLQIFPDEWEILGVTNASRMSILTPSPVMPT